MTLLSAMVEVPEGCPRSGRDGSADFGGFARVQRSAYDLPATYVSRRPWLRQIDSASKRLAMGTPIPMGRV